MNKMYKKQGDKTMSSTKLIVLKSKELIYTAILLALVIVFVIIFINMFHNKNDHRSDTASETMATSRGTDPAASVNETHYTPGTYSSTLKLGDNTLSVMVTVDADYITDVAFKQIDDAVTTMYPLLETSLEDINTQLHYVSSVDDITPSGDSTYTTRLIIDSIRNALKDAVIN